MASGLGTAIVDFANDKITILDPAHLHFATLAFSEYAGQVMAAVPTPSAAVQKIMSAMKMTSGSRLTGRTAEIQGVQTEEHEFDVLVSGPIGPNARHLPWCGS